MPVNHSGDDVTEITIDAETVSEVTMDGDVVYTAGGGGGGDTGLFDGTVIDDFESTSLSAYNVLAGNSAAWQFTDATQEPLGGRTGYANTVDVSQATYTVDTESELLDAISNASSGDLIYLTSDIDTTGRGHSVDIPQGVDLASDRGIDGSRGKKFIYGIRDQESDGSGYGLELAGDNRVTGLRIEGPHYTWGPDYGDTVGNTMTKAEYQAEYEQYGLKFRGDNIEIDNCELYAGGGGQIAGATGGGNGWHIHHCHIHRGTTDGYGYGMERADADLTGKDGLLIEHNVFNYCRHFIAGVGTGSYYAENNSAEGPVSGNNYDQHDRSNNTGGGVRMDVYNNFFCIDDMGKYPSGDLHSPSWYGGFPCHFIQRGTPDDGLYYYDNWGYNPNPPEPGRWGGVTISQNSDYTDRYATDGFENVFWDDAREQYGRDAPSDSSIGLLGDGRRLISNGSHALKAATGYQWCHIKSDTGLNAYPSQGESFHYFFRIEHDSAFRGVFQFAVQDETTANGHYEIDHNNGKLQLQLDHHDTPASDDETLDEITVNWEPMTTYRVDVDWVDYTDGITVELYNHSEGVKIGELFSTDTTYTSGGIGFISYAYASMFFDDVRFKADSGGGSGSVGGGGGGGGGGGETGTGDPQPSNETVVDTFEDESTSEYTVVLGDRANWQFTDGRDEPIGGGAFYQDTIPESDADYTASTYTELMNALGSASSGDIVYLTSDIDTTHVTSESGVPDVPNGVTLAGDRGIDGSLGPIVYVNERRFWTPAGIFASGDSRLTGFRIEGPFDDWSPENALQNEGYDKWEQYGIYCQGGGVEIDNMEVYGFGSTCVNLSGSPAHVHHNNIHHGLVDGQGYGVAYADSTTRSIIEYNRFSFCRHMLSNGGSGTTFTFRHNIIDPPWGGNCLDVHCNGGNDVRYLNNTVIACWTDNPYNSPWHNSSTDTNASIIQRCDPSTLIRAHDNWFWNYKGVEPDGGSDFGQHAIEKAETSGWVNDDFASNTFGHTSRGTGDGSVDGRQLRSVGYHALACYSHRGKPQHIQSTSGLPVYPEAGDTMRFWFRVEQAMASDPFFAQFQFGVQSEGTSQNYYELELEPGTIRLQVDNAGSDTTLGSDSITWGAQVPYYVTIDWPSDPASTGIGVTVHEELTGNLVASFTASPDDSWTSGGVGWFVNSNPTVLFDDLVVLDEAQ